MTILTTLFKSILIVIITCSLAFGQIVSGSTYNPWTGELDKTVSDDHIEELMWLIPPIIEWYDPTEGLPVDPEVGDRYGADATAEGWTIDYIYEWDGTEWVESPPEEGWMVWDLFGLIFWTFFSGGWMEEGTTSFLLLDASNDPITGDLEVQGTGTFGGGDDQVCGVTHGECIDFDDVGDGVISFKSVGGTYDESIDFDLDTVSNEVDLSSRTGVDTLNVEMNMFVQGQGSYESTTYPVMDIVRDTTTSNGGLYAGAKLQRKMTGGTAANESGLGFYFTTPNDAGEQTFTGIFGGALSNVTDGSEIGDLVFGASYHGADPYTRKHMRVRAVNSTQGVVIVPYQLQVGLDQNPTTGLNVYGGAEFTSGNVELTSTSNFGINVTPTVDLDVAGNAKFLYGAFPVVDIIRQTSGGGGIYGGAKMERSVTGTSTDGTGVGFYYKSTDDAGNSTFAGMIGGGLADVSNGTEVGEIVIGTSWRNTDPYNVRVLVVTATGSSSGNVTVPNGRLGVGISTAPGSTLEVNGGITPDKVTEDPCGGAGFQEGSLFYNDTGNYFCYCDGTNDVQMHDPSTACF